MSSEVENEKRVEMLFLPGKWFASQTSMSTTISILTKPPHGWTHNAHLDKALKHPLESNPPGWIFLIRKSPICKKVVSKKTFNACWILQHRQGGVLFHTTWRFYGSGFLFHSQRWSFSADLCRSRQLLSPWGGAAHDSYPSQLLCSSPSAHRDWKIWGMKT